MESYSKLNIHNNENNNVLNNSLTPESSTYTISKSTTDTSQRRKKRKIPKSCYFCRKRKLKCDHSRPTCNQCSSRQLTGCVYMEAYNYNVTSSELLVDAPHEILLKKINDLELELTKYKNSSHVATNCPFGNHSSSNASPNTYDNVFNSKVNNVDPLSISELVGVNDSVNYITKEPQDFSSFRFIYGGNKWSVYYGTTSWKTIVQQSGDVYNTEYNKIGNVLLPMNRNWKKEHGVKIMTSEFLLCNTILSGKKNSSLFESVIEVLPSYNEILTCIEVYFNSPLHKLYGILDKEKVMREFQSSVIEVNPDTKIVTFNSSEENYFSFGVLLMIIIYAKWKINVPEAVYEFVALLSGSTEYHFNKIEKLQFLFLNYLSKVYFQQDWFSGRDTVDSVMHLCSSLISLGLSDLNWWYKSNTFDNVGSYESVRNLWYHILIADVLTSFDCGKPLALGDSFINAKQFNISLTDNAEYSNRRLLLAKQFLRISRSYVNEMNASRCKVNVSYHVANLVKFIEKSFSPLNLYINTKINESNFDDLIDDFDHLLLAPCIGMLINSHSILNYTLKDSSAMLISGLCKYIIIGLSLCNNIYRKLYFRHLKARENSDNSELPEIILDDREMNLNMLTLINFSLCARTLTEAYALFFLHLTTINKNWIIIDNTATTFNDPLDTVSVTNSTSISIKSTTLKFFELFDMFTSLHDNYLEKLTINSFYIFMINEFQRLSKSLFEKGVESRIKAENNLGSENVDISSLSKEQLDLLEKEIYLDYLQLTQESWNLGFPSLYNDNILESDLLPTQ
ncbi:hypothetical protein TPHA_0F02540 [Tetrapisispora phaffii CBS 4417]|uniref:Zn(2)-C6 fungal-type domain-containing protein n=1 Tax=Tetrapisispora phaffii (strain ATCC 24235 / CBS 4417 / NBRC 1672 / NRRL Y-8282 / UCD 70-5) TaxID=1071381 RepID=G8BUE9_TETPH|nr:hypothetical protein TPHA_0F02540 [Tetrapisispora phaffii CBS 4417]CCE63735.1 hypothetical protein TPHA_0F02540 [Tetrapisispora phaffii CBS 4417]